MSEKKKPDLSADGRDRIIKKILDVKEVCEFLQMNGVDIQHLSIKNILSK